MKKNKKGFTLIEVLVTLVVMAIGLLGLAGLQINSLRNNLTAEQRGSASQLAYDMMDRMRSNVDRANLVALDAYTTAGATEEATCKTAVGCSPAQQTGHDLFEWNRDISNALPLGQGNIATSGGVYTITILWDDERDGVLDASDASAAFIARFQP